MILTNAPSLYRGHFSASSRVVCTREAGSCQQAQSCQARPTAQHLHHLCNLATSVSTQQRGQLLNVSEFNCYHLSQIKEDTGEYVPVWEFNPIACRRLADNSAALSPVRTHDLRSHIQPACTTASGLSPQSHRGRLFLVFFV